jgi:hypothetical protein
MIYLSHARTGNEVVARGLLGEETVTAPSVLGLRPNPPPPTSGVALLGEETVTAPSVLGLRPNPPPPTSGVALLGEETVTAPSGVEHQLDA